MIRKPLITKKTSTPTLPDRPIAFAIGEVREPSGLMRVGEQDQGDGDGPQAVERGMRPAESHGGSSRSGRRASITPAGPREAGALRRPAGTRPGTDSGAPIGDEESAEIESGLLVMGRHSPGTRPRKGSQCTKIRTKSEIPSRHPMLTSTSVERNRCPTLTPGAERPGWRPAGTPRPGPPGT